jgi:hypothetical protein
MQPFSSTALTPPNTQRLNTTENLTLQKPKVMMHEAAVAESIGREIDLCMSFCHENIVKVGGARGAGSVRFAAAQVAPVPFPCTCEGGA